MTAEAAAHGIGEGTVQFRLKDWGVSRQRYWGTPIPIINCAACGLVPVPDQRPAGAAADDHRVHRAGRFAAGARAGVRQRAVPDVRRARLGARRTRWTRSSIRPGTSTGSAIRRTRRCRSDPAAVNYWGPVDFYSGGVEHAILHLIYSRFFSRVFRDVGPGLDRRAVHAPADAGHGAAARRRHVEVQGQRRRSRRHDRQVRRRRPAPLRDVRRAAREGSRVDGHRPRGVVPVPRAASGGWSTT